MTEIIFEVTEDEVDGGYSASALGHGIHTQGDSVEEIRSNVKEAVDCYFDDTMPRPKLIRLHFRAGRDSRGMKLPRNVSGATLQASLRRVIGPTAYPTSTSAPAAAYPVSAPRQPPKSGPQSRQPPTATLPLAPEAQRPQGLTLP